MVENMISSVSRSSLVLQLPQARTIHPVASFGADSAILDSILSYTASDSFAQIQVHLRGYAGYFVHCRSPASTWQDMQRWCTFSQHHSLVHETLVSQMSMIDKGLAWLQHWKNGLPIHDFVSEVYRYYPIKRKGFWFGHCMLEPILDPQRVVCRPNSHSVLRIGGVRQRWGSDWCVCEGHHKSPAR